MQQPKTPGRRRGRRPGRAGRRHLARPPRRGDDARRAPGRAVLAAARDRGEPALDGADPLLGRRGRRPRGRRRRRVARMAVATPWPAVAEGSMWPVGIPTREQAAVLSPTAPACVPQDHLEPVLLEHLRSLGGARVHLHTEVVGVQRPARRRRGRAARRRRAASCAPSAPATSSPPTARTARSARRSASPCAGPTASRHVVTALFRAPLWQVVGEHRYGIYSVSHPHGAGTFLPAGRGDRWLYGTWVDAHDVERLHAGALRAAHPRRRRHRRPRRLDRAHRRLQLRRPAGRPLPRRQRLPRRRRRPPGDPARRHRDEHRDRAAATTWAGSSAGCCAAGPGPSCWTPTRPSGGRSPRTTSPAPPIPTARRATTADELHVDLGGRIPHVWVRTDGGRVSTLDLLGPGLTLFTGPDHAERGAARPPAGRRSPSAAWTPSARARSASAAAARCSCAPTARPRACGPTRRPPPEPR